MIKNSKLIHYYWEGVDQNGFKISGSAKLHSKKALIDQLQNKQIILLSVKKQQSKIILSSNKSFTQKQRLNFTQELFWLLKTGTQLTEALSLQAEACQNGVMRKILIDIKLQIDNGNSFSSALKIYRNEFSNQYINLIEAGEQSGCLTEMIQQLISYEEKITQLKSKILKSMIYPVSVIIIAILLFIGLVIFVIPHFQQMYQSFNAKLPFLTQQLINMSQHLMHHWLLISLTIIFPAYVFYIAYKNYLAFNIFIKRILIKLPLIKNIIINFNIVMWSQIFATTLTAGIPFIDALKISNSSITNALFKAEMISLEDNLISGVSLQESIQSLKILPLRAKQLIIIGENTDNLLPIINKLAALYHQILDDLLDHLSKLVEPVIMILLSIGVAGFIIAMYLPIFEMGNIM